MEYLKSLLQNTDWTLILQSIVDTDYFDNLLISVVKEYENNVCYPDKHQIFNAFKLCCFSKVKVVIIGQDPYHGVNEANGLAFSVNDGVKIPPSLRNIFKEINTDLDQTMMPTSGSLNYWAKQGVLLLNSTLTVQQNLPNSHKNLDWQKFTDAVIEQVSQQKSNVVFMLWGNFAIQKLKFINSEKHLILQSGHPSPLSANQGKWFGNKHFSQANEFLKQKNIIPIEW
jgi:uracil-DNA glycosylase